MYNPSFKFSSPEVLMGDFVGTGCVAFRNWYVCFFCHYLHIPRQVICTASMSCKLTASIAIVTMIKRPVRKGLPLSKAAGSSRVSGQRQARPFGSFLRACFQCVRMHSLAHSLLTEDAAVLSVIRSKLGSVHLHHLPLSFHTNQHRTPFIQSSP